MPAEITKTGAAGQWLEADSPGETGLIYRLQAQVVDFTLTCRRSDKALTIRTAYPGPPPKAGDLARLKLGASEVEAIVVDEPSVAGPGAVAARTPVNQLVITALANARAVGLTYRGVSIETGPDPASYLRYFAQACARFSQ